MGTYPTLQLNKWVLSPPLWLGSLSDQGPHLCFLDREGLGEERITQAGNRDAARTPDAQELRGLGHKPQASPSQLLPSKLLSSLNLFLK